MDIKSVIRLSACLIAGLIVGRLFAGQAYYSPISINSAQVPSTQTDFPVLVSQTDNRFKTTGNGGHVANSNGYDIRPYSDSGLTTAITGYELERYNASTGEVIMWVKVGSLSSSTTPIYLGYGDTSLTTDGSSSTTWSNNYKIVDHIKDGTTLSVTNSVGGTTDNVSTSQPTPTPGQIDGGAAFSGNNDRYIHNDSVLGAGANGTLSGWVKATSFPNGYNAMACGDQAGSVEQCIFVKSNGKLAVYFYAGSYAFYDGNGSTTLSTGTWYYLTATYDTTAGLIGYVNASVDGTASQTGSSMAITTFKVGVDQVSSNREWNGIIDEVRWSNVARSANWITTEYNNQSAPGTFETLGTEVALTASSPGWFYFFP